MNLSEHALVPVSGLIHALVEKERGEERKVNKAAESGFEKHTSSALMLKEERATHFERFIF